MIVVVLAAVSAPVAWLTAFWILVSHLPDTIEEW